MKSLVAFSMVFFFLVFDLSAQNQKDRFDFGQYYYGFKGGVNYTRIEDIRATIIPPFFSEETFNTEIVPQMGYSGGIFFYSSFWLFLPGFPIRDYVQSTAQPV